MGAEKSHAFFDNTTSWDSLYIQGKKLIEKFLVNGGVVEISKKQCTLLTEDIVKSKDFEIVNNNDLIEISKKKLVDNPYYSLIYVFFKHL